MAGKAVIAVGQMCSGSSRRANFRVCSELARRAKAAEAELLCLPECFHFLGRSSKESVKIGESLDGTGENVYVDDDRDIHDEEWYREKGSIQRYKDLAKDVGIWLSLGGFQERSDDPSRIHNAHLLISSSGELMATYRKVHLFDVDVPNGPILQESSFTMAGRDLVAADSPVGRLGMTTCYDLRFPAMYASLTRLGAEVMLIPSAFTVPTGEAHWEILLRARAIENQCYVVAAAQAGQHNEKRQSYGRAMIVSPWGEILADCGRESTVEMMTATVDFSRLASIRERMPCALHARPELY